jgi:hypothetical protein
MFAMNGHRAREALACGQALGGMGAICHMIAMAVMPDKDLSQTRVCVRVRMSSNVSECHFLPKNFRGSVSLPLIP